MLMLQFYTEKKDNFKNFVYFSFWGPFRRLYGKYRYQIVKLNGNNNIF